MFHHLEANNREKTLREVCPVLKHGGAFYLLDFEVSHPDSHHGLFSVRTGAGIGTAIQEKLP
jgi:hypothetical protein